MNSEDPGLSLEQVRTLLVEYQSESNCSVNCQNTALPRLQETKPVDHLLKLYEERDILWLGGGSWGIVCKAVGSDHCIPSLIKGLDDPDRWWRAFSCDALEVLQAHEAIPILLKLLDDHKPLLEPPEKGVFQIVGEPTVAVFAASALAKMGRADGVFLLLDQSERVLESMPKHSDISIIPVPYLRDYRALSGMDFGDDINAWRKWFREH